MSARSGRARRHRRRLERLVPVRDRAGRVADRRDEPAGETRAALRGLDRCLPGRWRGRAVPARVGRGCRLRRPDPGRPRSADATLRFGARRPDGRSDLTGAHTASDRRGQQAWDPRRCSRGVPGRLHRLGRDRLPGSALVGGDVRSTAGRGDGFAHRAEHAFGRRPSGASAGARRRRRPTLGTSRGDDRRGSLPGRHDRIRVRPRASEHAGSSRRSSTSSGTRPPRRAATSHPCRWVRASSPTCWRFRSRWRCGKPACAV